jgi:RNA recognition motif-containing protein
MMPCTSHEQEQITSATVDVACPTKSKRRKKPRKKNVLGQADMDPQAKYTTVMIQGVPWTYKESDVLKLLIHLIGRNTVNFFYMPWNPKRNTNSGCAFVNFTSCYAAVRCTTLLNGHTFEGGSKTIKPCMVVAAHVQGLVKNLEYYRYRAVGARDYAHAPMVFKDGARINFQMAVEKLCPKKSKKGRMLTNGEDPTKISEGKDFQANMGKESIYSSFPWEDECQIAAPSFWHSLRKEDDVTEPPSDNEVSTTHTSDDERHGFGNCAQQLMYGYEEQSQQQRHQWQKDFPNESDLWSDPQQVDQIESLLRFL